MVDPLTTTAVVAAGAFGAARGLSGFARRRYRPPVSALGRSVATIWASTADGWRLSVDHHRPDGAARGAVILCHGLGINRSFFDVTPEVSLARRLARAGFEVFNCDLRGSGASAYVGEGAAPPFTFESHAAYDVPALLELARDVSGAARVHWVGHSMGGMLLLAHLGAWPTDGRIASGTVICSPTSFADMHRQAQRVMRTSDVLSRVMRIPSSVWPWMAPLVPALPVRTHLIDLSNFDGPVLRSVLYRSREHIETPLLRQFARFFADDVWDSPDGVDYRATLGGITTPLYFMAAAADRVAPPSSVEYGHRAVSSPINRFEVFGRATGFALDYCHGGLIAGRTAPIEIYPRIEGWLRARAGS